MSSSGDNDSKGNGFEINENDIVLDSDRLKGGFPIITTEANPTINITPHPLVVNRPFCTECGAEVVTSSVKQPQKGHYQLAYLCVACGHLYKLTADDGPIQWLMCAALEQREEPFEECDTLEDVVRLAKDLKKNPT
jgi:DNA-directed RNA polymerase subunit RPC12/RpoP